MSWSDPVAGTRRAVLLGGCFMLGACTLRPLLHATGQDAVRRELQAVKVTGLDGRLGQLVYNALLDEINPGGADMPSRYILHVRLRREADALGIQTDDEITRFNLELTADFELADAKSGETLYDSQIRRIASYNVSLQPYATLAAETDAERRVAQEMGNNIGVILAVYFARQPSAI